MHRYQCPLWHSLHDRDREPKCGAHGLGYSPTCPTCVQVAAQIAQACGGTR